LGRTLACKSHEANTGENSAAAQMNVDGPPILDEPLHLHDVVGSCAALEVTNHAKERGERDDADANRRHKAEDVVESVHVREVNDPSSTTRRSGGASGGREGRW